MTSEIANGLSLEKRYAIVNRPPSFSQVPLGYLRVEHIDKGHPLHTIARYGVIVYDRVLTQLERDAYELCEILDDSQIAQCVDFAVGEMAENREEWLSLLKDDRDYVRSAVLNAFQIMHRGQQSKPVIVDWNGFVETVFKKLSEGQS